LSHSPLSSFGSSPFDPFDSSSGSSPFSSSGPGSSPFSTPSLPPSVNSPLPATLGASSSAPPPLPAPPKSLPSYTPPPSTSAAPPLPSAPHRQNPSQGVTSNRALPTPSGLVGNFATNSEVQARVGSSVANQANNKDIQSSVGNSIASNTDNKFMKGFATNSTVQKLAGKAVGAAANNKTVQQKVGEKVASEATKQEDKMREEMGFQKITPNQPPPIPKKQAMAKAVFDFAARENGELSFKVGDTFVVTSQEGGWWKGEHNGHKGEFPSNYVQLI